MGGQVHARMQETRKGRQGHRTPACLDALGTGKGFREVVLGSGSTLEILEEIFLSLTSPSRYQTPDNLISLVWDAGNRSF